MYILLKASAFVVAWAIRFRHDQIFTTINLYARAYDLICFRQFAMAKLLSIMLASLSISTNVLLGKDVCSHYDEKACVDPKVTKHGYYVNQWTISTTGIAKEDVKQLIENNGFVYLGQVTIFFTSIKFGYTII